MAVFSHATLTWDDPEETIIIINYAQHWTWDSYFNGVKWIVEQSTTRNVAINVITVNNFGSPSLPRGDFFTRARDLFPKLIKNGCTVTYVRPSPAVRALIAIFVRLVPSAAKHVSTAASIEEAREWILARRKQLAKDVETTQP